MLRTMVIAERQVRSSGDHSYAVRVMHYRTQVSVIQGAVITFMDITATKALEGRLRAAKAQPRLPSATGARAAARITRVGPCRRSAFSAARATPAATGLGAVGLGS